MLLLLVLLSLSSVHVPKLYRLFCVFFIAMHHGACKVEFQPFNRSYSQLTFLTFFINHVFLCSVAAVLLLLPLLVSPVSTFLKIKNRLSVVLSSPSQSVCSLPLARRLLLYRHTTAAVPQFLDGPSAAFAPAAAVAITD